MTVRRFAALLGASLIVAGCGCAADVTDPVLEGASLHSIGMRWVLSPASEGAKIEVAYRGAGGDWRNAAPLFAVEPGAHKPAKGKGSVEVPDGAKLFAGSLLLLEPGKDYEVKLIAKNADGGVLKESVLKARTKTEPVAPKDSKVFHVVPGAGGGTGTAADPFKGVQAAHAHAAPDCTFLLHAGVYPALVVKKSGEPGRPLIWRGAGDGETIIDGGEQSEGRLISADNLHDVWFEDLTIRRGGKAIVGLESGAMVVRRCKMSDVEYGIYVTRNSTDAVRDWFISDNVIEGPCTWPRSKGIENPRGIQLTGEGHIVCYNRISRFADAVDTFPSDRCANIDYHNNEVSEMTDDGAELDFSERNVRCFHNRFTNIFQGVSTQPVYGGPVYIFRNALYNVVAEPFKLHNSPSGALIFQNTIVKNGEPFFIQTPKPVRNSWTRNNLFVGTTGAYAIESSAKMPGCDFDYDGLAGGPWKLFAKWNGVRYATPQEMKAKAPVYKNVIAMESAGLFASDIAIPTDAQKVYSAVDLRLRASGKPIDAGQKLPGMNDGFAGNGPDLGAYEANEPLPHYGPRAATTR